MTITVVNVDNFNLSMVLLSMISYKPLAETIKEKGLTLKDVSEKAGLSESILVCKMNNSEYISMESLDKICNALEIPVESVIQWVKGKQKTAKKVNVNWEFVSRRLAEKGMSLNELSEKCRLDRSALCHSKKRNGLLRERTVQLMAKVLECEMEDVAEKGR